MATEQNDTTIAPTKDEGWVIVKQHLPGVDTKTTFYVRPLQLFGEINQEDQKVMHGLKCIALKGTMLVEGESSRPAREGELCVVWLKTGLHPLLTLAGCDLMIEPHTKRTTRNGQQFRPYDISMRPSSKPAMIAIRSLNELDHERLPAGFVDEALLQRQLLPHDVSPSMTETIDVDD